MSRSLPLLRHVAIALSVAACLPGMARADALDAMWIVAVPLIAAWALFALVALTIAWHSARGGHRLGTLSGLTGVWLAAAPPILIALGDGVVGYGGNILWNGVLWIALPGGAAATATAMAIHTVRRVRRESAPEGT